MKRDKYDTAFSTLIRKKNNYTCERCHTYYPEGNRRGIHCSHYMGRTNQATRFHEDNADCLCYGCHSFFEDRKQTAYRDWKIEKQGLESVEAVEQLSRTVCKRTKKQKDGLYEEMNQKIKDLGYI